MAQTRNYLQDELIDTAGKDLCQRIDTHIIASLLVDTGWTEVVVDPWKHSSSDAINCWCKVNIGEFIKDGNRWVIENPKDATIFSLRWA